MKQERHSLTHRGWLIQYIFLPRYSSGPEVSWSRWTATKEGHSPLMGRDNQQSNCPAYGDAIEAIDRIEIPWAFKPINKTEPYEGVL